MKLNVNVNTDRSDPRISRFGARLIGVLALIVASCSSAEPTVREDPAPAPDGGSGLVVNARDCMSLLDTYQETDLSTAGERELLRQMQEASLNEGVCHEALLATYEGPGGTVMAAHLARSIGLHALQAELALSERFDEMAGYCSILEDIVEVLRTDALEIDTYLREGRPNEEDLHQLLPLGELTLQTLQLSLLDYAESCSDTPRRTRPT